MYGVMLITNHKAKRVHKTKDLGKALNKEYELRAQGLRAYTVEPTTTKQVVVFVCGRANPNYFSMVKW